MDEKESRDKYNTCKYIVKQWEKKFRQEKGRLPSKLDIREADKKIRYAYKTYFELKMAALEDSLSEVMQDLEASDGDEQLSEPLTQEIPEEVSQEVPKEAAQDIWGEHLNKPKSKPEEAPEEPQKRDSELFAPSKKIFESFCKSKFKLRNPNKALRKPEKKQLQTEDQNLPVSSSSVAAGVAETEISVIDAPKTSFTLPVVVKEIQVCAAKPLNPIDSLLNADLRPERKPIDLAWLERCIKASEKDLAQTPPVPSQDSAFSDEDIIYDSDEEEKALRHSKKLRLDEPPEAAKAAQAEAATRDTPLAATPQKNTAEVAVAKTGVFQSPVIPVIEPQTALVSRAKKRLEDRIATGRLNENFVSINLKKKNYVRGKKNMKFSTYKKKQYYKTKAQMEKAPPVAGLTPLEELDDDLLETLLEMEEKAGRATGQDLASEESDSDERENGDTGPLYDLLEDGSVRDTPEEVFDALRLFGHEEFRPGQERVIMRILSGLPTVATLRTGSGKTLCYQIPAYLYAKKRKCITLVISPLISLMQDQATRVAKCLKVACLHSGLTAHMHKKITEELKMGKLDVLLVSPETLVAGDKPNGLGAALAHLPPVAFACIDEAHCVSQWSHNFRPTYLMLGKVLRERMGVKTVLGLTATATMQTRNDIVKHFQIPDGLNGIIRDIPLPDNLVLSVSKEGDRDAALVRLLTQPPCCDFDSIIVYCTRREDAERLAVLVRTIPKYAMKRRRHSRFRTLCEAYHAGLAGYQRRSIQKAFMAGDLRVVVATVAFGMGIDKANIRAVIHYNMPRSIEGYVQEVGRAGRDGLRAFCHLFLGESDMDELKRHVYSDSVERHAVRKLLQKLFRKCSCEGECTLHEVAVPEEEVTAGLDMSEEVVATLLCYLELHEDNFLQVMPMAYTNCKLYANGGPAAIARQANYTPFLRAAMAKYPPSNEGFMEFPIVTLASEMGVESGKTKNMLKKLEYYEKNGEWKRSPLSFQFDTLGFRVKSKGNLSSAEMDRALDATFGRALLQEKNSLLQLQAMYSLVAPHAAGTWGQAFGLEGATDAALKTSIREYFEAEDPLKGLPDLPIVPADEEAISRDIRQMMGIWKDTQFTARGIARIFQGIHSTKYPAYIWSAKKFWRAHVATDFRELMRIALKVILSTRTTASTSSD